MRNITLSADEHLIDQARQIAQANHKTLNFAFREWLEEYTKQRATAEDYDALMAELDHVDAGRKFSRDEMNER